MAKCRLVYKLTIDCECSNINILTMSIEEIVKQFPEYIKGLANTNETVRVKLDKKKIKEQ